MNTKEIQGRLTHIENGLETWEFRGADGQRAFIRQSSQPSKMDGMTYVWIGTEHGGQLMLHRDQVETLIDRLGNWLESGSFESEDTR